MGITLSEKIREDYDGKFFVIVADIMFENWIVADIEQLKTNFPKLIK